MQRFSAAEGLNEYEQVRRDQVLPWPWFACLQAAGCISNVLAPPRHPVPGSLACTLHFDRPAAAGDPIRCAQSQAPTPHPLPPPSQATVRETAHDYRRLTVQTDLPCVLRLNQECSPFFHSPKTGHGARGCA